ncbi:hypothetical protein YC2023_017960 [Brassica napus]
MADASNGSEYFDIDVETGRKSSARPLNAETVEQDEEDLRLAAIGRLPSQRQGSHLATLRRSQTSGYADGNVVQTIDVRKLDRPDREMLLPLAIRIITSFSPLSRNGSIACFKQFENDED